jgi:lipopolysaccharide/colanic/teichoic acid biosynthesis glycosyltransferase
VRVGREGREFVIHKFRTMYTDAEARPAELRHHNEHDGVIFKIREDPRVTAMGRCPTRSPRTPTTCGAGWR